MAKFKKAWMRILMALTVVAMGLSVCPALAATQFTGVTTSALNVRTSPSSKSTRFKKLAKGEKIKIVAKVSKGNKVNGITADMNYYKLNTGGYVAAQYVKVTGTITTDETPTADTDQTASEEEETSDLSDLEADSEDDEESDDESEDSDSDDDSEDSEDSDDSNDIALVESDGSQIDPDTADTTNTDETDTTTVDADKLAANKMRAKSGVNVRTAPSTSAAVMKKLNGGEVVTTIANYHDSDTYQDETVSGSWMQLNSGGFVAAEYLETAEMKSGSTSKTSTSSKKVTKTTATAKSNVTMYSSPNKLATQKGTMKKGSSQQVTGTYSSGSTYKSWKVSGSWYKLSNGLFVQAGSMSVKSSSSTVNSSNTVKVSTTSIAAADYFKAGDGVRMRKNVNMRKGPGTSYSVIRLMQGGETVVIEKVIKSGSSVDGKKVSDTWIKIVGENGYIHADYIEFDAAKTVEYATENGGIGGVISAVATNTNTEKTQEELEAGLAEE